MSVAIITKSETVTKEDIVRDAMKKIDLTKAEATVLVNGVIESISNAIISGRRVELRGFGVIEKTTRKPKKGYNFKTKQEVVIPARSSVKFKTSKTLDRKLNS